MLEVPLPAMRRACADAPGNPGFARPLPAGITIPATSTTNPRVLYNFCTLVHTIFENRKQHGPGLPAPGSGYKKPCGLKQPLHVNTRTGMYQCSGCGKLFPTEHGVKTHIKFQLKFKNRLGIHWQVSRNGGLQIQVSRPGQSSRGISQVQK